MKITDEITSIYQLQTWSGAKDTQERIIKEDKGDEFMQLIEELYPEGIDMTHLNDILWFDSDWVYEMLGITDDDESEDE